MVTTVIAWTIQLLLVPAASPLCVGIIRKLKARLQNRQGAGIFQPYKNLWKLFHKDEVISRDASWIFTAAPYIVFSITILIGSAIPLFLLTTSNTVISDILVVVYGLAIGTFFLALAGVDTGSAFGGFGSSREMTMAALSEGGFIFSLLTIALVSNSANLFTIAQNGIFMQSQLLLPVALAFFAFFIVCEQM